MATRREFSRLDRADAAGPGALRAVLTRVGVFPYVIATPEGDTVIREYRPAREVFAQASLDSLRAAPLVEGHPAFIDGANWAALAKGHIGDDVAPDGEFVRATAHVKDGNTLARVVNGDLVELSCGYTADLVAESGTYDGQPYDAVQTNIRYNHVGLGPKDWGRAGNDVRVFLDSAEAVTHSNGEDMLKVTNALRSDSGTPAPAPAPAPARNDSPAITHTIDIVALVASKEKAETRASELESQVTALEARLTALAAANTAQATSDEIGARIALLAQAKGFGVECPTTDSADTIRAKVLAKLSPSTKTDGKDPGAIALAFEVATAAHAAAMAGAKDSASRVDSALAGAGNDAPSPIDVGRAKQAAKFHGTTRPFGGKVG